MSTSLNQKGLLPTSQPYSTAPWNYSGTESVSSSFFTSHDSIVDWILVELRSTYNGAAVARRAGLIKSNGEIVDTNYTSKLQFYNVAAGSYYIVIRHRNHLPVMSPAVVEINTASSVYD